MNERLVQFDVRYRRNDYVDTFWDEAHRNNFLLQPETEWPLSVDPLAWPSVFFSKVFRDASEFPYGSIEVDPAIDDGKYWLNLEQMRAHYEAYKQPGIGGVFVAIHLFSERSLKGETIPYLLPGGIQAALVLGNTNPTQCPPGSESLGYDVADGSRISGLANCGYPPDEKEQLAPVWTPRLNSFGLLKTLEDATEFKQVCDNRVAGHAPFWVYGISKLPIHD